MYIPPIKKKLLDMNMISLWFHYTKIFDKLHFHRMFIQTMGNLVIFDVLVAVAVKIMVFWDVTPCRYVLMFQRNMSVRLHSITSKMTVVIRCEMFMCLQLILHSHELSCIMTVTQFYLPEWKMTLISDESPRKHICQGKMYLSQFKTTPRT